MKMNKQIENLKKTLENLEAAMTEATRGIMAQAAATKQELRNAYFDVFNADKSLKAAISASEMSDNYGSDEFGIYAWTRYAVPSEYQGDADAMDALANFIEDFGLRFDAENDTIILHYGDDEIIIQDDTRRDNGVWQSGKLIIAESAYTDDSGDVDVEKRNALIEAHMERTGYFPGVFRVTRYGDVFFVNTKAKQSA
jgi:hypothetical protein